MRIRAAAESERRRALEVTLDAYSEYAAVMRASYWESYRDHIVETVSDPGAGEQLVAAIGASIVGAAIYYEPGESFGEDVETGVSSPDCPEVRLVAVAPEGRGGGVGRAIMEAAVERARASGAPGLVIHTMEMMRAARSLYDSMGFVRAPELDFQPAKEWFVEGFRLDFDRG